jgi:membrane dipeptidase
MTQKLLSLAIAALLLTSCGKPAATSSDVTADLAAAAARIATSSIIVDTHIDVPYRLNLTPDDISKATENGDFDLPRAQAGGLNAPFMSIYTPASLEAQGGSKKVADELMDMVDGFATQWPDKFAIARSTTDVRAHFKSGILSLPLGMENGSPIEGDLENLQYFYDRGIRYITPAHSKSNHICDSSYDSNRQWHGLSEFGVRVIREMNRLGIMVDVSHVSDEAFWQILELSEVPLIASHSSARHFTPGFERNMSDAMIIAMAKQGGVIQINFGSSFITAAAQQYVAARGDARKIYGTEHPELSDHDLQTVFAEVYATTHGAFPFASLADVLDHFDHVVALTSVDSVGIGSDYDGVGDSLPTDLKDVAAYPNLIEGLLHRGYSESDIRKMLGENLLRVWAANEAHAAQAATTSSST